MMIYGCRLTVLAGAMVATTAAMVPADVYRLVDYPELQNGLSQSGTLIAADLDNNTQLTPDELSSWMLTIDGTTSTSDSPIANSLLSNVSIANGMIFLEDPAVSGVNEQLILAIALDAFVNYFNGPHSEDFSEQVYNGRSGPVPSPSWSVGTLSTNGPNLPMPESNGRMVIARLVPEPSAMVLLAIGGLVLQFVRGIRR